MRLRQCVAQREYISDVLFISLASNIQKTIVISLEKCQDANFPSDYTLAALTFTAYTRALTAPIPCYRAISRDPT